MSAPKRKVSRRQRIKIYKRDGCRCIYCLISISPTSKGATVDHVVPQSLGGTNRNSNLVAACSVCNNAKGDQSLNYYLESLDPQMCDPIATKTRIQRQTSISMTPEDAHLLEQFLDLAQQAHDLKHDKFDAGNNWPSTRKRLVGMGRPNYHVRRLLFELAVLKESTS